ncbi:MAG: vWA domain-containing protein [Pirellulales bacterium]
MLKRLESDNYEPANDAQALLVDADLEDEELETESSSWFDADTQAFLVSLMFHVVLVLGLAIVPVIAQLKPEMIFVASASEEHEVEEFKLVEQVAASDQLSAEIGANSDARDAGMALSMAPVLADVSDLPSIIDHEPVKDAQFSINDTLEQPVGLVRNPIVVKGMTGEGTSGVDGAVDRITYEILRSMEESPTLVVWFFDQSGSLTRQRDDIRKRFERIYEELGIVRDMQEKQGKKIADEQLLTAVFAFGKQVHLLTPKPTADLNEITEAIDSIENDPDGIERVFSAVYAGIEKFKGYRSSRSGKEPRNVMFVIVTDERGDDANGLDKTINDCVKFAIPVYVMGVPAPFGRDITFVKYVDPDPKFDQTPQWAEVDQGPESIFPERVRVGFRDNYFDEPVIDSGFGPYALSRLAYETGGIYFTIHPNRKIGSRVRREEVAAFASDIQYFFDPEVMAKYRPDYVTTGEYLKLVEKSPLRRVLINAARMPRADVLSDPEMRFVKRDDASFVNLLSEAQRKPARVEPALIQLAEILKQGEQFRNAEVSPRWIASFDLSLGTVLAHKVRAESYNLMLAKAKRGLKFEKEKNNTWVLRPSNEISVGSKLEKEGQYAVNLLKEVAQKHKGTPWGLLAEIELRNPIGWKWTEDYTDLNPPPPRRNNPPPNNPPPMPRDDQARMLAPPPPKRPVPKL